MAHFATRASERHYHYQTISTGSNLPEAANVLQRIPRHARVVLIRTDASQDDITTLRAALPTEDIITGVDPLVPYDSNAWDALNNLSVARAAIAGAEVWDMKQLTAALSPTLGPLSSTPPFSDMRDPIRRDIARQDTIGAQASAMAQQGIDLSEYEAELSLRRLLADTMRQLAAAQPARSLQGHLRLRVIVSGANPLNLNIGSVGIRMLSCYQISCQVIMDGLACRLDLSRYTRVCDLEANVQFTTPRSSGHGALASLIPIAAHERARPEGGLTRPCGTTIPAASLTLIDALGQFHTLP